MMSGGAAGVAPFVAKTYGMVDDPATDAVVAWGPASNSFVVADPFAFSEMLLPAHFKHSNFSSFVRQLNTYGFRKVDSDRWEFAHVLFLRGQTHLLPQIVRRRSSSGGGAAHSCGTDDDYENIITMVATEVILLRHEQKAIEDSMAVMWRRVHDTERRPKQMLAFLLKVVRDPDVLLHLVGNSGNSSSHGGSDEGAEVKRLRLLLDREVVGKEMPLDGGSLYDINQEVFVPEPSIDFIGFHGGGNGFCDVQVDGAGADPSCAFPMDSGY